MSVVADFKEIGPCRRQVSIEVPEAAVEAEVERVVQTFRKHAKAPGFRKGKMPVSLVRQRYREDIEKEVLDRLIPRYWNQARAEKGLDPLLAPEVDEVDFADTRLSFVATVEVRPEIELGDLEDFDLPDPATLAEEAEIDAALEKLRYDAGDWVGVERAAADGDLVDAHITEEGVEHDGEEPHDHTHDVSFEVGDERVWTELSDAARGLTAGERAAFERAAEAEDAPAKSFAVEIATVKERRLPELDDALAARLGEFESVDALRGKVAESIVASKREERQRERERALLDQLRDRHHFPLPEGVVETEIEGLLREYANGLAGRGVDVENADIDWQQLAEQVRPQATQRVEARLLLDAIAAEREVTVSSEEFEATLAALARAEKTSTVALRQAMDRSGQLDRLRMQLRRQKTLKMLLGDDPVGEPGEESVIGPESAVGDASLSSEDSEE